MKDKLCIICNKPFKSNSNRQKQCSEYNKKRKKMGRPNKYPLHITKLLKNNRTKFLQDIIKRFGLYPIEISNIA